MFDHIRKQQELVKSNLYGEDSIEKGDSNKPIQKDIKKEVNESKKEEKDKNKLLGKTKSGKEVFSHTEPNDYKDFDANDHRDAGDLHHIAASGKDGFPGHYRTMRNKHTDEAIKGAKKVEKDKLKNQPAIGDKVTTKEGVGGDVRQRDETHTYIEHKDEEGKIKVSKIKNEDLDSKIAAGHYAHHKPTNVIKKSETDEAFDQLIKGGEGSKGGNIIGHTRSGKPVYEGSEHHKTMKAYHNFSSSNHIQHAASIRKNIAKLKQKDHGKESAEQTTIHQRELEKKAKIHEDIAFMKKSEDTDELTKGGEGSHGGKVIGHTKSGKPIYGGAMDKPSDHKDFSKQDHKDSSDINMLISKQHYQDYKRGGLQDGAQASLRRSKIHKDKAEQHLNLSEETKIKKSEDEMTLEKAQEIVNDTLEKGFKGGGAAIGTIKDMGGRDYIKTVTGWKYHAKGTGGSPKPQPSEASHVMGHVPAVNHALESEKMAADKMSDIAFRFKAFAMFTKRVIAGGAKSMIAYGTGGVGKTYTVTQQLAAAGKREFDATEMAPGSDEYDYVKITGKMTAPQVYKTLFQHNGKIIMFDDCDSVLRDASAINLFKGALDTSGDGTIAYGTSSGVKSDEDPETGETTKLPNRFKFDGRCIFISNLPPDQVPQPLKSRALKIDLTMTKQQTIDRIREISTHPTTKQLTNLRFKEIPKYTHDQLDKVISYLDKNKDHIGDLNVRTVGKMLGIHLDAHEMGEGHSWEQFADQELFSKAQEAQDFYNGGIMKAQQRFAGSIYKSEAEKQNQNKKQRTGEATSGIHIDNEQLEDEEAKEDGYDSDDKDEDVKKGGSGSGPHKSMTPRELIAKRDYHEAVLEEYKHRPETDNDVIHHKGELAKYKKELEGRVSKSNDDELN